MKKRLQITGCHNKLGIRNQRNPILRLNRFGNEKLMFQSQTKLGSREHVSLNQTKSGNLKMICQNETF
ncbi:hypothetical protein Hanom_Chr12g01133071 [Helianthus anomalus]